VLRHAIPGLGNVWQVTLKDTSLISVTGLVEIMRQSRIASNVEHSPLTFLVTAAFLYLFLTTFSGKFFNFIEKQTKKGFITS
jgi:octopine/nopaline transport system permease protein